MRRFLPAACSIVDDETEPLPPWDLPPAAGAAASKGDVVADLEGERETVTLAGRWANMMEERKAERWQKKSVGC